MTDDLRARIAAALRDAAHYCDGDCGKTETECDAEHPVQVAVWHFGVVADVTGPVDALAGAVLAVVQPIADERDRLTAALRQHETCRTCGHERHEHAHDSVIRADYCGRCTVSSDVHDFQPEEQP